MTDLAAALDRTVLVLQDYVAASDEEIVAALTAARVRLSASAESLSEANAQVALLSAFEAVSRVGVDVVLDIPRDVPNLVRVPPLSAGDLYDAIEQLSTRLLRPLGAEGDCDLTISLDDLPGQDALALGASDFDARLRVRQTAGGFMGELPFGAVLAGAAAGAEVARLVVRRLIEAGHAPVDLLRLEHAEVTLSLPPFAYPQSGLTLDDVDFVSAGAITHAALFTLARAPKLTLAGRVFDDDEAAEHNLNRYVLLDAEALGAPKEEQLVTLDWPAFHLEPVHGRVGEGELSEAKLAERVLVGVDSVRARWDIQRLAPGWVGVGATSHALAMVSQHWPDTPCSGCVHPQASPPPDRLPTISFVSMLCGALLAYRLVQQAVAPIHATEVDYVLDALKLSSDEPFFTERPNASPHCLVGCSASRTEHPVETQLS